MGLKIFFFSIIMSLLFFPKTSDITGKVTDNYGNPINGAFVVVLEYPSIKSYTNKKGKYTLKDVPDDAKNIIVSYKFSKTKTVKIKNRTEINITLKPKDKKESEDLDEMKLSKSIMRTEKFDAVTFYDYESSSSVGEKDKTGYDPYISSGQLTAGEVNDFGKWKMWQDITDNQLNKYIDLWNIYPNKRYSLMLTSDDNKPVIDANVYLKTGNNTIWTAKTDNTGKAELWANMFDSTGTKNITIQVEHKGIVNSINNPTTFYNGINKMTIQTQCYIPNSVDIAFVIDATGSMSDELQYLQAELLNVIKRVDTTHDDLDINLASVFYRDDGDDYITKNKDFSNTFVDAINYIKEQYAGGGGDFPEAVHSAMNVAINDLSWNENARARIIFLVLDAPPHNDKDIIKKLNQITKNAAKKGIRIVPITCSGIDKSTEYLMRSMALATNGTYVFLTDDSGIGNPHIEPTTDEWNVEFLNDLIVRLINQYVVTPNCKNEIFVNKDDLKEDTILVNFPDTIIAQIDTIIKDTLIANVDTIASDTQNVTVNPPIEQKLKIYPNPTSGLINVEVEGEIKEFYVCDFSGKILQRELVDKRRLIQVNLHMYPNGIYFIRYFINEALKSGKVVLMR